jgi:hypothetical protein
LGTDFGQAWAARQQKAPGGSGPYAKADWFKLRELAEEEALKQYPDARDAEVRAKQVPYIFASLQAQYLAAQGGGGGGMDDLGEPSNETVDALARLLSERYPDR